MTGEDLGLKPSTVEQAKFEYSPLGKIFNKGLSKDDKKEGILKRLENIKDRNDELLITFNTTNKSSKNKINTQSMKLMYNTKYSFAKLKNIGDIKKLSLNSMYNLMKDHHKKFTKLNKLVPRTEHNINKNKKVLINAENLYNELYYIYKNKYNKKINNLDIKNRKSLIIKNQDFLTIISTHQKKNKKKYKKNEKKQKLIWMNLVNILLKKKHT